MNNPCVSVGGEEIDEMSEVKFVSIGASTSVTFFIPARKSDEQQIVMIESVKPIIAIATKN